MSLTLVLYEERMANGRVAIATCRGTGTELA
jgi:hypothetical protein